jgi:monoamine oxidase
MAPRDDKPLIEFHDASRMPDPQFYSHSVSLSQASRLVFTSGVIAVRPDGTFPETLEEQTKTVYENLKDILKNSGATPRDLIKVTFYPVDWSFDQAETLFKPFFDFITDDYGITYRPITTLIPVTQLAFPGPKLEIEVVAAIGGHAIPYVNPAIQKFKRPVPPLKVDVVVVGGGFSGIQAAWDLHKAGLTSIVLEAKHRIGGRSRTAPLRSGPGLIELGATWINQKTQPRAYATAKRLKLDMVEQYVEGDEIWQLGDGTILRSTPGSVCDMMTNCVHSTDRS